LQDRLPRPHRLHRPAPQAVVEEIERLRRQRLELVGDFKKAGPSTGSRAIQNRFGSMTLSSRSLVGLCLIASMTSPPIPVGWVSGSIDHDTVTFAVNSIRSWWHRLGRTRYPDAVIVQLISATTTTGTGLTIHREVDENRYPKGFTISDAELATIDITRADFHVTGTKQYPPRDRALIL
jgi:Rhodopirellula transposase DDE domain